MSLFASFCVNEEILTNISVIFNALGNPTRLKILKLVSESNRPLHIKAISRMLKMRYTAVYRHVSILKNAGLVTIYEVGRSRVVSIAKPELINEFLNFATKLT